MHLHKLLVCAVVVVDTTCLDMQLHTEDRRDNVFEFIRVTYGGKEETTCLNLSVFPSSELKSIESLSDPPSELCL